MKTHIILLLIMGVQSGIAKPVSKQEPLSNNEPPLSDTNKSEVKHEEDTPTKIDQTSIKIEANEDLLPTPDLSEYKPNDGDNEVDVVIEENITPLENIPDTQNDIRIVEDEDYLSPNQNSVIDNILVERFKDEIMETAAGFAPIPIFRRRHKQPLRRRFAIRRQYQRYPYAPYRRLPIYYPYYRFYRPSSLRFY